MERGNLTLMIRNLLFLIGGIICICKYCLLLFLFDLELWMFHFQLLCYINIYYVILTMIMFDYQLLLGINNYYLGLTIIISN